MTDERTIASRATIDEICRLDDRIATLRSQLAAANARAETAERERDWMLDQWMPADFGRGWTMGLGEPVFRGDTPLDALRNAMAAESKGTEHD